MLVELVRSSVVGIRVTVRIDESRKEDAMSAPGKTATGSAVAFGCLLLLCGGAIKCSAQVSPDQASKAAIFSTPLELIHEKPYVSVTVNGRGPFRFLVDTGTGGEALVSPELADELALPVVGHARLVDPSGQGEQRSDIREIRSLQIGGAEFNGIKAIRHRLYGEGVNCQGVLGFTLFKNYLLTLDFPGHRLVLAVGAIDPDGGDSVLPFRMPDGVPIMPLRIAGQRLEAQIDSGGTGLSLPETVAAKLKFQATPVAFSNGESLATRFQIKAARLRPDVRFGGYAFKQAFVEINPAFPLVNFGSTPLQRFVVTFDQRRLLVRFESTQKMLHLDASPTTMQLLNEPKRETSDRGLVPVG
ncbi:MAG TPA: aspartyl protease family protein [Terracidiphilus sp.]|jgi:predicted aspartyl protease